MSGPNVVGPALQAVPGVPPPYALDAAEVATELGSDPSTGLTTTEASSRLPRFGPNQITGEKPPSVLVVALTQLRDPMNIMLIAVTVVSFADRSGVDRGHRRPVDLAERGARVASGAEGQGERGRAVEPAGAAGEGGARRRSGAGPGGARWFPVTLSSWRPATSCPRTAGSSGPRRWRRRRPR